MTKTFSTINPFTESVIETYSYQQQEFVNDALKKAGVAFQRWQQTSISTRQNYIQAVRQTLINKRTELAHTITSEMGKPLRESLAEVDKCALLCSYYIDHVEQLLADKIENFPDKHVRHTLKPTGAVFGIMPWNYPIWQVFRYAIPNLIAGNVVLLKHAPNTTGCSLALHALFSQPSFESFVFQSLVIDVDMVEHVIANPIVQGVCLTGSVGAGKSVGALAGKHLKKVVLELGSADAFIILPNASLDKALDANFTSRTQNAGQACIAAKRTFVPKDKFKYAIDYLSAKLQSIRLGNPLEETTTVGPIAKKAFVDVLSSQVQKAEHNGGKRHVGALAHGVFFEPGIIETTSANPVNQEEVFGPVINLIAYDNEDQLLHEVNETEFGLAASVWSADYEYANRIASQVNAGTIVINDFVKSDPRIPFGGIKHSGFGRELGEAGLRSFLNEKPIITNKPQT